MATISYNGQEYELITVDRHVSRMIYLNGATNITIVWAGNDFPIAYQDVKTKDGYKYVAHRYMKNKVFPYGICEPGLVVKYIFNS